jgi:Glycosyl hydrolases family 15
VRDASFTMQALWVAACPDEASNFFEFMTTAAASSIGPHMGLQIMFGVGGEHDLTERELNHLTGWQDSRPVRVGNGAWNQRQIDVYGEVLGAAAQLSEHIDTIDEDTRRFLIACAGGRRCLMDREGPGHLGGARRSPALCVFQGHVLGGTRSCHCAIRSAARRRPGRQLEAATRPDLRDRHT